MAGEPSAPAASDLEPAIAPPRLLFVTGRLAEPSLRRVVGELAEKKRFQAEIAVLPISVAALMTTKWVARHLEIPPGVERVILPGACRGDLALIEPKTQGATIERGPDDLRDLPGRFGLERDGAIDLEAHDIEILAEINHAPGLSRADLVALANRLAAQGADVIDVGCDPGSTWSAAGDAVRALRDLGLRVSIDSFDETEVRDAVAAGAEIVLSVNASNREQAPRWGATVVVVPDTPGTLDGLDVTIAFLEREGVHYCIDPVIEPIGFGFAASLGRYLEVRARYPHADMLMGVGNLTELTDVDSAGVNMLLVGFCQELGITRVLTTSVINWARTSTRELDIARRLVHHAVTRKTLPKNLDPRLIMLRDPKVAEFGAQGLAEIKHGIRDPNWRIFAEGGLIHAMNNSQYLTSDDPFVLFEQTGVVEPSHAFYLGYELMKAKTALTLGKTYRQDQSLDWGFLTEPETSHRGRRERSRPAVSEPTTSGPPTDRPDDEASA